MQLSAVENTKHGQLIASQMLDVTIRVKAVRSYAVKKLVRIVIYKCTINVIYRNTPNRSRSLEIARGKREWISKLLRARYRESGQEEDSYFTKIISEWRGKSGNLFSEC